MAAGRGLWGWWSKLLPSKDFIFGLNGPTPPPRLGDKMWQFWKSVSLPGLKSDCLRYGTGRDHLLLPGALPAVSLYFLRSSSKFVEARPHFAEENPEHLRGKGTCQGAGLISGGRIGSAIHGA